MTHAKHVLLLSHTQDYYNIDLVAQALEKLNYQPIRWNTDDFPEHMQITEAISQEAQGGTICIGKENMRQEQIAALWIRKVAGPRQSPELDPRFAVGAARESSEVVNQFIRYLSHTRPTIDNMDKVLAASDKYYQLRVARLAGLELPDTIITNEPQQVIDFYEKHKGDVVTKMLTPLSTGMQATGFFVYTSKLAPDYKDDLEGLQFSPMVFQNNIHKAYELRIAYVNGHCFAGKIDASGSQKGQTDWRQSEKTGNVWQPYEVPTELCQKLKVLMQHLGLAFGAIDVIKDTNGRYVFLEVNPAGEWGMLQKFLDLPIAEQIAQTLHEMIGQHNPGQLYI